MASQSKAKPPKALLFDIGGVCVVSPFQAILDYEKSLNIPVGWVNFAISGTKPDGSWHRAERGEMDLDATFFAEFNKDLRHPALWEEWIRRTRGDGAAATQAIPAVPDIDGEWLLKEILRVSQRPDPYMAPALQRLKASGRFLLAALSNTMPTPPAGAKLDARGADGQLLVDVRSLFDPYVSSAHSGVRKPERRAYELALKLMRDKFAGEGSLEPGDVVFLDDIGENLKAGREMGFRTLKVRLGDTKSAVRELEGITGLSLLDESEGGQGGAKL